MLPLCHAAPQMLVTLTDTQQSNAILSQPQSTKIVADPKTCQNLFFGALYELIHEVDAAAACQAFHLRLPSNLTFLAP